MKESCSQKDEAQPEVFRGRGPTCALRSACAYIALISSSVMVQEDICLIEPVYYAFPDNRDSCSSSFFAENLSHSDTKMKSGPTPIRTAEEDVISASVLCRHYRAKVGCRAIDVSFV